MLFQSTLPCGSDLNKKNLAKFKAISIHAPLRERRMSNYNVCRKSKFQSTLPCGSDFLTQSVLLILSRFQSTLPCGSDLQSADYLILWDYFNPRSLAGATSLSRIQPLYAQISIHAPLRERLPRFYCHSVYSNFNPRSLAGATHVVRPITINGTDFNPRSLAGATLVSALSLAMTRISIHAPLRERRLV